MTGLLLVLTLLVTAAVIVVLVAYLLAIIVALARARASLKRLVGHLTRTHDQTRALPEQMQRINEALPQLLEGLAAVNGHLESIVTLAAGARGGGDDRRDVGSGA